MLNGQRALVEHLLWESWSTLEDITREVVDSVIDESLVGEVARFAIHEALRSAGVQPANPQRVPRCREIVPRTALIITIIFETLGVPRMPLIS